MKILRLFRLMFGFQPARDGSGKSGALLHWSWCQVCLQCCHFTPQIANTNIYSLQWNKFNIVEWIKDQRSRWLLLCAFRTPMRYNQVIVNYKSNDNVEKSPFCHLHKWDVKINLRQQYSNRLLSLHIWSVAHWRWIWIDIFCFDMFVWAQI
jgi:hypothetical protein